MSSKKLVFVNRYFCPDHSATSQILTDLTFDLAGEGFEVSVVTSRLRYDRTDDILPAYEVIEGVKVHRVWTSRFGRQMLAGRLVDYLSFYVAALGTVWRLADERTVLVCKTDPPLLTVLLTPLARLRRSETVNWLQDLFPEVANRLRVPFVHGNMLRLMRSLRNRSLSAARTNVVLGERMKELLVSEGVPAERLRIIPNWADGTQISPVPSECNPLRHEWGLDGCFVVGYSGNFGRAHEFETILAAAEALNHDKRIVFLFIGSGAQHRFLLEEARNRSLSNIEFRPYQPRERLSQSLSVADAHLVTLSPTMEGLIVPSKYYGIAAAGRPTIFIGDTDGEIPRILRQSASGRSCASGDAETLVNMIRHLAVDRQACAALGAQARRFFEQNFDRKLAVDAWKQVLFELAPPSGRNAMKDAVVEAT